MLYVMAFVLLASLGWALYSLLGCVFPFRPFADRNTALASFVGAFAIFSATALVSTDVGPYVGQTSQAQAEATAPVQL